MTQEQFAILVAVWLRRGTWSPNEAARLLSEQPPYRPPYVDKDAPETGMAWHILDLMLSFPEFRNERTPSDWIEWAFERGLHINVALQPQALPVVAVTPEAAPEQDAAIPAPVVKRAKRKTWRDVALDYVVGVYRTEQYATTKDLFKALQNKAGAESPFDVGTGANRGNLFVRELGKGLALRTLENAMPEIKAAKK